MPTLEINDQELILDHLINYLQENPSVRFGQALFNLCINEFADKKDPGAKDYLFRDIYNDSDSEILKRIQDGKSS